MAHADAWRRLRLADDRRLDGLAEERLGRYRPLCARQYRPHRRIADRHRRRRRLLCPHRRCTEQLRRPLHLHHQRHDARGALLDDHALRPGGQARRQHHRPPQFHQRRDRAQRRRQFRHHGGAAGAARQLAADRRRRQIRAGAAPLRHADRRLHRHHQGRPDAVDRAQGLRHDPRAVVDSRASFSAASSTCRRCWPCRRRRTRTPIRGSRL